MTWRPEGWFVLAGIVVCVTAVVPPIVRWALAHRGALAG